MSPTIHLVRHAEGPHNIPGGDLIRDPGLTAKGVQQCIKLNNEFPTMNRVTQIVSSPLRRCILTSLQSFRPVLAQGVRVQLMPQIQETGDRPSAYGTPTEELVAEFGQILDTTMMEPGWMDKRPEGKYAPDIVATKARATDARILLRDIARQANPEDEIVVVTHCVMAHMLAQDSSFVGWGWGNAGYRSYKFVNLHGHDNDEAPLVETENSPGLLGQWVAARKVANLTT